jgi:CRP-like cAMP-binding protein
LSLLAKYSLKEIAHRVDGDVVGEMSLISGDTRIASVIALGDVRV